MNKSGGKPYLNVEIKRRLRDFSLDISFLAGSGCLGILGPSGCGKSMTLKSIAGIVTPDSGRIIVNNRNGERILYDSESRCDLVPQKRKVGYLFQNYALFPNLTVTDNIAAGIIHREDREQQVRAMINRFRLEGLEDCYPRQLSGGQQQRVALARILAYEPDVLLLDEPFSAMDAYLREGLRLELAEVLAGYQGVTVMVTHDRDEVYQLCDRLLLMDQGQVLAAGLTRELFEAPGTCQAARLTGCKNISRIERTGRYRIRALDWGRIELTTAQPVDDSVSAVGIRAHDFEPLTAAAAAAWQEKPDGNLIRAGRTVVSEMPFEWYVTLENGLWWKTEKTIRTHDRSILEAEWLRIDPSAILLLTGTPDSQTSGIRR